MSIRELSGDAVAMSDMGVRDLVDQIVTLLSRVASLEEQLAEAHAELAQLRPTMCGELYNTMGVSCQLSRDHTGAHAWRSLDEVFIVKW